jgi:hypothetical protein
MKKGFKIILFPLIAIAGLFTGFLIRQPGINKLRKQAQLLQSDNEKLQNCLKRHQDTFDDLYLQYKGLKVMELKNKAEYKDKLKNNLVLQYSIKDYLELLFDVTKNERKLTNEECIFYKAFDGVIEGKKINNRNFEIIKEYVISNHGKEINDLKKCYLDDEKNS